MKYIFADFDQIKEWLVLAKLAKIQRCQLVNTSENGRSKEFQDEIRQVLKQGGFEKQFVYPMPRVLDAPSDPVLLKCCEIEAFLDLLARGADNATFIVFDTANLLGEDEHILAEHFLLTKFIQVSQTTGLSTSVLSLARFKLKHNHS